MLAAVLASSLAHVHSALANQSQNSSVAPTPTIPVMERADNIDPVPIPPPGEKGSSFGDAVGMQFKAIIGFFSVEFLLKLFGALLVLVFFLIMRWILCRLVRRGIRKWHEHEPDFDETLPDFLERCMWYTITAIGLVAALSALGVPTTTLVTVLGAFALAASLAIQDIVGSMMAGVLLISRRPFRLHDYVNLMGGGEKAEGTVVALDIVQTVLLTREHRYIYVPNKAVLAGIIINHSRSNILLKQVWAVGYKENVDKVKALLMDILKSNRQISTDPPPKVKLNELKSDWMELMTEASVHVDSEGAVRHWIIEQVRSRFEAAGIAMSDTSAMDVNIYNCGSGPADQAMLGGQGTGVAAGASVVEPEKKISGLH